MKYAGKPLVAFRGAVLGDDAIRLAMEGQLESVLVVTAAGEAPLVCCFIIELVGVLHGRRPVYQPFFRETELGPTI
jgi:hypothetical protein